jgi:hypothetical protein
MNIIPTIIEPTHIQVEHTIIENILPHQILNYKKDGLKCLYTCFEYDDAENSHVPTKMGAGRGISNGVQEFSIDNQAILSKHFNDLLLRKDKINIVEIGVNRNPYNISSTSIFLDGKRKDDIYVGIDIEDKSFLNDVNNNVFTIKSPSQNISNIFNKLNDYGIGEIDLLMIDGWHSINQIYLEWCFYTKLLSENGIVVIHDTNAHLGPYFLVKSIDTDIYDVYKYVNDVQDYGISVAIKK